MPKPPDYPRSYLSSTRPHVNTPSFFAKSHIPHSARRSPESHVASTSLNKGDCSSSLHPVATEASSIYASHKSHQYISHSVEDTNSQHPHDNMDGITHDLLPPRLEPTFYVNRAGTQDVTQSRILNLDHPRKGAGEKDKQPRSSEDLTIGGRQYPGRGDFECSQDLETYLCAVYRTHCLRCLKDYRLKFRIDSLG
jgi:hypothetical protein